MEIVWKNNRIRNQVESKVESNSKCRKRMDQLKNASCYLDIPASAQAHFLSGDLNGLFAVDFDYPARLICEPVGDFQVKEEQYIKETIKSVEIIKIEIDYHQK
jgi:hypothetical protein